MNESRDLNRRTFVKGAALLAVATPLGGLSLWGCTQKGSLARTAPSETTNVPWKTTIVAAGEAGEPLIVSGTIYAPDGRKR